MGAESQSQYFVGKNEGLDGNTLSVFFAPNSTKFVIPKEVLRAKSEDEFATRSLWNLITGTLHPRDELTQSFEPTSIEQVRQNLDEFLRTQPADELFVDEDAPEEIRRALESVQEALTEESQTRLANMFGLEIPVTPQEDTRKYPGLYL